MGTLRGFYISMPDNGSFYFEDTDAPACPVCGLVDDPCWINPSFELGRRQHDLSATYDGARIASQRFVEFCDSWGGVRFLEIPNTGGFHLVVVDRVVKFDEGVDERTKEDLCPHCQRYVAIAGPRPLCPSKGETIHPGFSRTEFLYGSGHNIPNRKTLQHPRSLVDPAGADLLRSEFPGLSFAPIEC